MMPIPIKIMLVENKMVTMVAVNPGTLTLKNNFRTTNHSPSKKEPIDKTTPIMVMSFKGTVL